MKPPELTDEEWDNIPVDSKERINYGLSICSKEGRINFLLLAVRMAAINKGHHDNIKLLEGFRDTLSKRKVGLNLWSRIMNF